jgi:hypothetical protein
VAFITIVAVSVSAQRQSTRSPHGPLNIPCENCHTATSWTPIRAVPEFNHDSTRYPLRGMHEKVSCTGCHLKPVFTDVGKNCADCHADIHRRQFGANCAQCHTVNGWNVSVQSINNHFNRFPLLGAHAVVQCDQCHTGAAVGNFLGLSTACDSCHMKDWQNTTSPAHAAAPSAFPPNECQQCHQSFDTWLGSTAVNHAAPPINFPLTQGHANVPCEQCHIGNNYHLQIALSDCGNSQCHLTTWQQTNNPPHQSAGAAFALANCTNCHTPASWTTATFDHSTTGFPLTLGHANLACASCHINNNYNLTITARDCGNSQCHLSTWQQTNTPVHSTSGPNFAAANCANCHTPAGWTSAAFDHSVTGFTLIGTHMSPTPTPCASCHVNNNYTLSSTDCYGCHQAAYLNTQTMGGSVPNHVTANFPITASACASCHPITTWAAGTFDHASFGFPLTNGHANVACNLCHINNNYSLQIAATDCGNSQCHLITYNQTNAPPHAANANSFPIAQCSTCHTTISWTAAFNHSTTGFALTGLHISPVPTPCASCHINNNYSLTSAACINCHTSEWQSTQTLGGSVPNHITSGFPQDCSICHSTSNWTTSTFNHAATTFPLTGAHTTTACALCHVGPTGYSGNLPTTCDGCHDALYQSTATMGGSVPNHVALTYPKTCDSCHTTTSWLGAVFNHNTTGFPLTGAHVATACNLCHTSATPPPNTCSGCHMDKWLSTQTLGGQVPNHVAAALISSSGITLAGCANCHNTTAWTGAVFTHSWFPLNHGGNAAGGVCSVCHIVSGDYSQFQCTVCHGNNNAANFQHPNVGGYAYNSVACYGCHTH